LFMCLFYLSTASLRNIHWKSVFFCFFVNFHFFFTDNTFITSHAQNNTNILQV
jgi:hypothetical protein